MGTNKSGRWLTVCVLVALGAFATAPQEQQKEIPAALLEANQRFAFDLFRRLAAKEPTQNMVVAPLSVSLAFGLLQNGASEAARKEIGQALGFGGMPPEEINLGMATLRKRLSFDVPMPKVNSILARPYPNGIRISNAMWAKRPHGFRDAIVEINRTYYGFALNELPLEERAATEEINAFAAKDAGGKAIRAVASVQDDDFVVLSNMHLNCGWGHPFEKKNTKDDDFHMPLGKSKRVPMMTDTGALLDYMRGPGVQGVVLDCYEVLLHVLLPDENSSLGELTRNLTGESWDGMRKAKRTSVLELHLPRFRVEYDVAVQGVLQEMGVRAAFREGEFEAFRALVTHPDGARLTRVLQNTFVQVDEHGMKAGSATYSGGIYGGIFGGAPPPRLIVNRPFVFVITEKSSGSILILGMVVDP